MKPEEVKELLKKISSGDFSKAQEDILNQWLDGADQQEYETMLGWWQELLQTEDVHVDEHPALISRIEAGLNRIDVPTVPLYAKKSGGSFFKVAIAAASMLLVLTAGLFFYNRHTAVSGSGANAFSSDIRPGGNNATLILANGAQIDLSKAADGELANEAGIKIVKSADGQLVYTILNGGSGSRSLFNTIQTPIGGQYRINLPDGSSVWLNASSSLRYPVSFSAKERKVELTGEAYFEIAKDKSKPFLVVNKNQTVEVLGTHFNINGYEDELDTKTTLLEGSVKIFAGVNKSEAILKPGQQAQVQGYTIKIKDVDAANAAAWKDGFFVFNDENISSAMRKIARWYDLDVVYKGKIDEEDLAGEVPRSTNIAEVLKTLELTGMVRFEIEGRKITVIPN